jgi:predicted N-acetyltransferase YhbS
MNVARLTDPARLPEILAVIHAAFAPLVIDPPSGALRETVADLEARLATDTVFIAEEGAEIAGSVFCTPQEGALYVGRLAVSPQHQRRGVAKALMAEADAEARRLGLPQLTLRARIMLKGNVAFFNTCGFAVAAEHAHEGYARPTSYEMIKNLA